MKLPAASFQHPLPPKTHDVPPRICVFLGSSPGRGRANSSPAHLSAARSLAYTLHRHSIHLVYGGGTTGLMGELAKTLVTLSGPDSVHGIIATSVMGDERRPVGQQRRSGEREKELLPRHWTRRLLVVGKDKDEGKGKGKSVAEKEKTASSTSLDEQYGRVTVTKSLEARKKAMIRLVRDGGPGSGFVALSGGFGTVDELMEVVSGSQRGMHGRGVVMFSVEGFWDGIVAWVNRAVEEGFVKEKARKCLVERDNAEDCVRWLTDYDLGRNPGRFQIKRGG